MPRLASASLLVLAGLVACGAGAPADQTSAVEWLTASATKIEFRSVAYSSKGKLLTGLRESRPVPTQISIRWVALRSEPAERDAAIANAAIAQAAAEEAGIRVSGMVGNEIFMPAKGASSSQR